MSRRFTLLAAALVIVAGALYLAAGGRASPVERASTDGELRVVATTSMLADAARQVGGERVRVAALMGPGVDPHVYRASEGDVARMSEADLILLNGLHLEGRMAEVLEKVEQLGKPTLAVAERLPRDKLRRSAAFQGSYDPHVWFDVGLWMHAVVEIRDAFIRVDPRHAEIYRANAAAYSGDLQELQLDVQSQIAGIPPAHRVLVTAHDAFGYFGEAYGVEVRGIQGISTASEASSADLQSLARFIAEKRIPAVFIESSVPPRIVRALQAAVQARGFDVAIGGELYSDALGGKQSGADTYIGMVRHNVSTIVDALAR